MAGLPDRAEGGCLTDPSTLFGYPLRYINTPLVAGVTTVDKAAANGEFTDKPSDARDVVTALAAEHGLVPAGETSFVGVGQSNDPAYTLLSFTRT